MTAPATGSPPRKPHQLAHHIAVSAPADEVYRLLADVSGWPAMFGPTVHVEPHGPRNEHGEETFTIWALTGDDVSSWASRRQLDPAARRIEFRQTEPPDPVTAMGGAWIVEQGLYGGSDVTLLHDFEVVGDDAKTVDFVCGLVDANSKAELSALRTRAELGGDADALVFGFEDSVEVRGSADDVFSFLWRAEAWPDALPHVAAVDLTEKDGVQTMDLHVNEPDGGTHALRSVRVALPGHRMVYKQLVLPPVLAVHTGEWRVAATATGATAVSRHTCVLRPEAIEPMLGAGTTLAEARAAVERAVGGNSSTTLTRARAYAEERAGDALHAVPGRGARP
ncbi:SRPBCC family protein [Yinghuangia sp. ASG 101]|uniref:aromatase/cyclase n=1 Tax=Yinghuangia sp. ASG 101 TaxID=2896848 RepID=UPI001E2A2365|nr:SRPBCC family protein [Yinghuangia sp. ASG 101]UGQ11785.1 SRPBCC family protein [Yinghuangia sp. ASG 101]